jgi:hypothetical protein
MNVSSISSISSTIAAIMEEALETPAQTRAEAFNGDMQAVRKLALMQNAQVQQQPEPTATTTQVVPGSRIGTLLNVKA